MGRITEHLEDRPRDAVYWLDAALVAVIVLLVAVAIVAGVWLFSIFFLSGAGVAAVAAFQPERIREPNPDAEDDAHDAKVQRDIDEADAAAMKRNSAGTSPEVLSLQDAFAEGARAGNMGTAPSLNPYQHNTPEHAEWERGRMGVIGFKLARSA